MLKNFTAMPLFVALIFAALILSKFRASAAEAPPEKKGVLLVAFGTSVPEAAKAIDNLAGATKAAFPDIEVRIAYTSNIIRRKLKREQGIEIPTPPEALAKMNDDGFTHAFVQPMHVIPGMEYDDLQSVVDGFALMGGKYGFRRIVLGRPFLSSFEDCETMAGILKRRFENRSGPDEAVVLMGHGTCHAADAMYASMHLALSRVSGNFFLGTVEGAPSFDDVLAELEKSSYKTLVLSPFMVVAGDHANNDLAGPDDPESWLSQFKKKGYGIETDLTGLGEYPEVAKLFVARIGQLME